MESERAAEVAALKATSDDRTDCPFSLKSTFNILISKYFMKNCYVFSDRDTYAGGFTLIEIVMVLVLLGILTAVAVPKYFDMADSAEAKTCQYNRGALLEALIHREVITAKLNGDVAAYQSAEIEASVAEVMKDVGGESCTSQSCPNLCRTGQITVTWAEGEGLHDYTVTCSVHGSSSNQTPTEEVTSVTKDNFSSFLKWLVDNYTQEITDAVGGKDTDIRTLEQFFSKHNSDKEDETGNIDSEADGFFKGDNYGSFTSLTTAVKESLKKAGIDTDNTIWRIQRKGSCATSAGCSYGGSFILTVADKPSESLSAGMVLESKSYSIDFKYAPNQGNKKGELIGMTINETGTDGTVTVKERKDDNNSPYWVIR